MKTTGFDEFNAAAEELAKAEGEIKLDAEREDTAALGEAATKAAPVLEEFEATATAYGFQNCGEGPTAPTNSAGATPGAEEEVTPEASEEVEAEPEVEVAPETGGIEEEAPESGGTGPNGGGTESGGSPAESARGNRGRKPSSSADVGRLAKGAH